MAETKPEHLRGHALRGPCDGKEFLHTADMRKVKIHDETKKPHIYIYHEDLSQEKEEAWKFGKA